MPTSCVYSRNSVIVYCIFITFDSVDECCVSASRRLVSSHIRYSTNKAAELSGQSAFIRRELSQHFSTVCAISSTLLILHATALYPLTEQSSNKNPGNNINKVHMLSLCCRAFGRQDYTQGEAAIVSQRC